MRTKERYEIYKDFNTKDWKVYDNEKKYEYM